MAVEGFMAPLLFGTLIQVVLWSRKARERERAVPTGRPEGSRDRPERMASPEISGGPCAAPVSRKAVAIETCRRAAEDYLDEYPREVDALLAKVSDWESAEGHGTRQGWAVYGQLGKLRLLVGEPLLRDPERAVLEAVTMA